MRLAGRMYCEEWGSDSRRNHGYSKLRLLDLLQKWMLEDLVALQPMRGVAPQQALDERHRSRRHVHGETYFL